MAVSIHGNNGFITTNGTASAPSFAAPDNDTGLYFGTNLIHATTGGVNRFNIDASGRVGIGTTTPTQKLEVLGTTNLYGNGGASAVWGNTGYTGHLTYDGSNNAVIRAASGKALIFQTDHVNERLRITSTGKVGINEDVPQSTLHVASTSNYVDIGLSNSTSGHTGSDGANIFLNNNLELALWNRESTGVIRFATAGLERARITSTGDVGINCTPHSNAGINLQIHGDNTTSEIRLTNTTTGNGNNGGTIQMGGNTLYISNSENDKIAFETNGSERLRITGGGDVQIDNDSGKFELGADQDISFYHTGTHGFLENDTGTFYIKGDTISLNKANGNNVLWTNGSEMRIYPQDVGFGGAVPGGTPAGKNVFLAIGDSDTGIVQDGDGQLEIWGNAVEVANFNAIDGYTSTKPITTTGAVQTGDLTILNGNPDLRLRDSNHAGNNTEHMIAFQDSSGNNQINIGSPYGNQHLYIKHGTNLLMQLKTDGRVCLDSTTGTFTVGGDNVYNSSKVNLQVGSMSQTSATTESTAIVIHDQNSKRNGTESSGSWVSGIRWMSTQINGGSRYGAFINQDITYNNFSGGATKMRSDLVFGTRGDLQTGTSDPPAERLRIRHDSSILHTRSDDVGRHDVEFRQTGGISNGNWGGIKWTQSSTGGTFLAGINIEYSDTGRPDMVFYRRDGGGTGSAETLRLDRDGKLILNGSGGCYLENSATNEWTIRTNGNVCTKFRANQRVHMPTVWSTNGSSMRDVQIESDGNLCAGNTSIRAAKKNIVSQTNVSWLYDLNPVTFNYRKHTVDEVTGVNTYLEETLDETSYGLIAEEVEAVKKDFCFYNKDKDGNDELAGVAYKELITPLLKALQDQKKEIDALKTKVAALEGS